MKNAASALALPSLVAALVLQAAGCELLTGPDDNRRGAKLLKRSVGRPAWATDGGAIYYVSRAGSRVTTFTINALDVASGRFSTLASLTGWNTGGEQVRTTDDPNTVLFAIANEDGSLQYSVYGVSTQGSPIDTVVTNAGWPWFSISSSGNRLVYRGPRHSSDTLQVVTLVDNEPTATVAIPTPGVRPNVLDVSPDGMTIVYGGPEAVYSVALPGGSHHLLLAANAGSVDSVKVVAPQVVWHGADSHLLVGSSTFAGGNRHVSVHNVSSVDGISTLLATLPDAIGAPMNLARSDDGRAWAAWVPVGIVDQNVERTTYRFRLYVQIDVGEPVQSMLEWTASEALYWLEFSPDHRQLALVLRGALYVVDV